MTHLGYIISHKKMTFNRDDEIKFKKGEEKVFCVRLTEEDIPECE